MLSRKLQQPEIKKRFLLWHFNVQFCAVQVSLSLCVFHWLSSPCYGLYKRWWKNEKKTFLKTFNFHKFFSFRKWGKTFFYSKIILVFFYEIIFPFFMHKVENKMLFLCNNCMNYKSTTRKLDIIWRKRCRISGWMHLNIYYICDKKTKME